jgi:16S rRNA processing protein RimM
LSRSNRYLERPNRCRELNRSCMELIAIGKVAKPLGIRGEIKIQPLTGDVKRFALLKSVWVGRKEETAVQIEIVSVRVDAGQASISLNGIENIDAAEQLRDQYLFVQKEEIIRLRKGSYFIDDVIGCEVVTEENKMVGEMTGLLSLPAQDVWVVWTGEKEILIPAVKEIVKQVDIRNKRITIHALEGLID